MLKRWFPVSFHEESTPLNGTSRNGSAEPAVPAVEPHRDTETLRPPAGSNPPGANLGPGKYAPFEQIYNSSAVKPPRIPYGILKVSDMVNSAHLTGMSQDAKRCSLLMALEAAGVELEDLLQDAVVRQRALNDYEESQRNRLKDFEQVKADENGKIQAELEKLTSQYVSRIQANLDEVAREQDSFRNWQTRKQQESQRITEAATLCVPQGSTVNPGSLAAVLERVSAARH